MAKLEYDELVQLLQDGNIGFLRFMLESDNAESYLELHGIEPSEESAEFYYDETEIDMLERQLIDDEDYGIWN